MAGEQAYLTLGCVRKDEGPRAGQKIDLLWIDDSVKEIDGSFDCGEIGMAQMSGSRGPRGASRDSDGAL